MKKSCLHHRIVRGVLACMLASMFSGIVLAQGENEVTPEVQGLYEQARAARKNGDDATAIEKYRQILKLAPHLAAAYNNLGMIYFDEHQYEQTIKVLEVALQLNPKIPGSAAMLGMSYFQLGQNDKARPLLESALRANPKDDQADRVLIKVLLNAGKTSEATARLKSFLERNPKDQEAWYLLGKTYLQLSEDALGKINEIDPDSVVAHEIAGEIDQSMHNYDLALVEYKKAVDKAPRQPGTHMHVADAYWNIGKWTTAEAEFREELQNDPNNCIARWKLANSMLEANESGDAAVAELNRSIDRCPGLMQARVDRARALVRLGKHADALPDLMLALKDSPGEPSIHYLLAAVYRSQGKREEAQAELETYSKLQKEASAKVATQAQDVTNLKNTPN
ncbi:MAG TPA: tetratricopeptide repeat protein [Terracidiphilus sp.]